MYKRERNCKLQKGILHFPSEFTVLCFTFSDHLVSHSLFNSLLQAVADSTHGTSFVRENLVIFLLFNILSNDIVCQPYALLLTLNLASKNVSWLTFKPKASMS